MNDLQMKKSIFHIVLLVTALTVLGSCSHNNGDIGYWFGLWHLDSIEIDGVQDKQYDGQYYFLFQGKVFCIRYVNEKNHEYTEGFARWEESNNGKTMTVSFVDYRFPPYIGDAFPNNYLSIVTRFNVITLNSTTMVLSYTNPDNGITYTYYLTNT